MDAGILSRPRMHLVVVHHPPLLTLLSRCDTRLLPKHSAHVHVTDGF